MASDHSITSTTIYSGNMIYDGNSILQYIMMEEGRIVKSGSNFSYEYFLRDNQGNTRAVFRGYAVGMPETMQAVSYTPFGNGMEDIAYDASNTPNNGFKYNTKEQQADGLNTYDYGWRQYDAILGRWNGIDKLAEKYCSYSGYNYCVNNPINYTDPNGMFSVDAFYNARQGDADYEKMQALRVRIGLDASIETVKNYIDRMNQLQFDPGNDWRPVIYDPYHQDSHSKSHSGYITAGREPEDPAFIVNHAPIDVVADRYSGEPLSGEYLHAYNVYWMNLDSEDGRNQAAEFFRNAGHANKGSQTAGSPAITSMQKTKRPTLSLDQKETLVGLSITISTMAVATIEIPPLALGLGIAATVLDVTVFISTLDAQSNNGQNIMTANNAINTTLIIMGIASPYNGLIITWCSVATSVIQP